LLFGSEIGAVHVETVSTLAARLGPVEIPRAGRE
jgi:hypothetical protein